MTLPADPRPTAPEPDTTFTQLFDAKDWAAAFVRYVTAKPSIATDEETMIGWFANAIMRGYDEYPRRNPEPSAARMVSAPTANDVQLLRNYLLVHHGIGLDTLNGLEAALAALTAERDRLKQTVALLEGEMRGSVAPEWPASQLMVNGWADRLAALTRDEGRPTTP